MRIINLASGSKGNSSLIEAGNVKILLDAGLTLANLAERLQSVGTKPEEIDAVIITHEHSDHIKGFVNFLKKYPARGYVPKQIVQSFLGDMPSEVKDKVIEAEEFDFRVGDIVVRPFSLPHDSIVCFGYSFEYQDKKVSFATDLGFMPESAMQKILGSNLVYIESNHDKNLLFACPKYPYIVKRRIASENGHLSNEQCGEVVSRLAKAGTKYFVLSHLSENTNTIEKAYVASAKALENAGFILERDVFLRYSRQDRPGNNFYFS